ncbi:hypothetical protein PUN28_016727 [Cardiocondyla obscurior]|uniref:Uncharacterized protein n=1 Tax=Cardiocondyla obscurior TaxID=286306 RepID=A0AAW2ETU9_9HYME
MRVKTRLEEWSKVHRVKTKREHGQFEMRETPTNKSSASIKSAEAWHDWRYFDERREKYREEEEEGEVKIEAARGFTRRVTLMKIAKDEVARAWRWRRR